MLKDTSLYCSLYWEEKPEKKNKSGALYSKSWDGILIKDKVSYRSWWRAHKGSLPRFSYSEEVLQLKMPRETNQFPSQNEKIKTSRDNLYWHLMWPKLMKKPQNLACFSWQIEKKNSQWDGLQREGNCALCFSSLLLGLISLLFSLFKNWFLNLIKKGFPCMQ